MDLIALSRLGGHHLVTLPLLLDSRSVTRSAERLCPPSSVSKTLSEQTQKNRVCRRMSVQQIGGDLGNDIV